MVASPFKPESAPTLAAPVVGPAVASAAPAAGPRGQIRLIVTLPAALILVALIYGSVSYLSFMQHWDDLERIGAFPIASALLRTHLTTMIVMTVVSGLFGVVLALSILRPVRALVEAAGRLAEGRLDTQASSAPAAPELEDLSRTFNRAVENLSATIAARDRGLIEGLPLGIVMVDGGGRVGLVSPAAAEILGLPADRLTGRSLQELVARVGPGVAALIEAMRDLPGPGGATLPREFELPPPAADPGAPARKVILTAGWLGGPEAEAPGVVFSLRDAAPLVALSDHLQRTDELAALGTFCMGLAHELRNPLGAIKGLAQLLQLERELPASARAYLDPMTREVDRVDGFIRQLMDLAARPDATGVPVDLGTVLAQASTQARHGAAEAKLAGVRLEHLIEPLPALRGDGERLVQAFTRLLQNAWEFTPVGGAITVEAGLDPEQAGQVCVRVRNTGSSIAERHLGRVFEPFFTTRERATGLGLAIARQIIAHHGGTLAVASGPSEVVFTAHLPVPFAAAAHVPAGEGVR